MKELTGGGSASAGLSLKMASEVKGCAEAAGQAAAQQDALVRLA
jgi:hypothetical protein